MILNGVSGSNTITFPAEGESRTITVLTSDSKTPYQAYYDMPFGWVDWMSIVMSDNIFVMTCESNLFEEEDRTATVRFFCKPTSSGSIEQVDVIVTQSGDTLEVTFNPASVPLTMFGTAVEVDLIGMPVDARANFDYPDWIKIEEVSLNKINVSADFNGGNERSGIVYVEVLSRHFFFNVTQAENDLEIDTDDETVYFGYKDELVQTITMTGIPVGASIGSGIAVDTPDWIKSVSYNAGVFTLTAKKSEEVGGRYGRFTVDVYGITVSVDLSQAANPSPYGVLVLDVTELDISPSGGSAIVKAVKMPTLAGATLNVKKVAEIDCLSCSSGEGVLSFSQKSDTEIEVIMSPQDIFGSEARSYNIVFEAAGSEAIVTASQEGTPIMHRLMGFGDKFVRREVSASEPIYLGQSTVQTMYDSFRKSGWTHLNSLMDPILVYNNPEGFLTKWDRFDAYKQYLERTTVDGVTYQQMTLGSMAYRIKFAPAAYGQVINGMRINVKSDPYCVHGLRLALHVSESGDDSPSTDCKIIREGSDDMFDKGVCKRTLASDNKYYGVELIKVYDQLDIEITANTRIYVYLSMEDYTTLELGWLYGSGCMVPMIDFFAENLEVGLDDDARITLVDSLDEVIDVPIVIDGIIGEPKMPYRDGINAREISMKEILVGNSFSEPSNEAVMASLPPLFAKVYYSGMDVVDFNRVTMDKWSSEQVGMVASITRHPGGTSSPFQHLLRYVISPIGAVISVRKNRTIKRLRIEHPVNASGDMTCAGAKVVLAIYWSASGTVTMQLLEELSKTISFANGGSSLSHDSFSAVKVGEVELPSSMSPGASLQAQLSAGVTNWGSFVLVPRIIGVDASTIAMRKYVGLGGLYVDDTVVQGKGWMPNITGITQ